MAAADAGGHETGWRRAECGIEPAAVAKAKLHLRSYFLRMRRNTYGLAHGLRDRFMDRRHTRLHSRLGHRREGASRRSMVHGHPVKYRAKNLAGACHDFLRKFLELIVHRTAEPAVRIELSPAVSPCKPVH